jgi:Mrp family chromosome partitioning ATPase/capsular polysaccharide biosynthesis protein
VTSTIDRIPEVGELPTASDRLRDLVKVARRHWLLIALVTLTAAFIAGFVASGQATQYQATAKLLLSNSDVIGSASPDTSSGAPDPERDTNTKIGLIRLGPVAQLVDTRLGLRMPVDELIGKVGTSVEGTSNIVDVMATDARPQRATAIANGFADEYVRFRRRIAQTALLQAAQGVRAQLDALTPAQQALGQGAALRARLRTLRLDAATQTGGAEVVLRASPPTSPSGPKSARSAALGGVIGLVLALVIVAALELFDRRIKDEDEAEDGFGVPVLAHIARSAVNAHKAALTNGYRVHNEGYERLASNIAFAARDRPTGCLLITSPSAGDGKSTVTLGLARALALLRKRVIVIDADLRRPAVAAETGTEGRRGLTRAVNDGASVARQLVPMDVVTMQRLERSRDKHDGSVSILPTGPVAHLAQDVLSRPAMARVVQECRGLADFVLIDTPPIGVLHDAALIVDSVDAALVISRLRWTRGDALRSTLHTLEGLGVPVLGLVVTDSSRVGGYYRRGTNGAASEPAAPAREALGRLAAERPPARRPASAQFTSKEDR